MPDNPNQTQPTPPLDSATMPRSRSLTEYVVLVKHSENRIFHQLTEIDEGADTVSARSPEGAVEKIADDSLRGYDGVAVIPESSFNLFQRTATFRKVGS